MTLHPGTRLGAYDIVSPLGAGGMGEVYRARDNKLGRDVALKLLPESVARDAERITRFRREAQVLASLNHPHIGAIYGFEEAGATPFLVLELVDGETLADRLMRGSIGVAEAIAIARQIVDALEEAHDKGIVHRDLKPANIALTSRDKVKVLDFGLAKLAMPAASAGASLAATLTSPAVITGTGTLLGTAAYMAPEQAKGRDADARSDIWAFGCVLYEMLSGRRAFNGDDVSDTIAAVLRDAPVAAALPQDLPPALHRLLRRCLEKDHGRRLADIADARFELDEAAGYEPPAAAAAMPAPRPARWPWIGGILIGAAAAAVAFAAWSATRSSALPVARAASLTIALPSDAALGEPGTRPTIAISPDGQHVAFASGAGSASAIYVRPLGGFGVTRVAGTDGATGPFFSWDGKWIAFTADGQIKKVPVGGGVAQTIAAAPMMRGATWLPDDTIIFAPSVIGPLMRVPASGGTPQRLTELDAARSEKTHRSPVALPGGKSIVFVAASDEVATYDDARLVMRSLETGAHTDLVTGGYSPVYSPSGHLLYARGGALFAVPFDSETGRVGTAPLQVIAGVATAPGYGTAEFDVSRDGTLIYALGGRSPAGAVLAWVDRSGKVEPVAGTERDYIGIDLGPDGRRMLWNIAGANNMLSIYDTMRNVATRLTFKYDIGGATWTPDGRRVTYGSGADIRSIAADGSGAEETIVAAATMAESGSLFGLPESWSPDGQTLAVILNRAGTGSDVFLYSRVARTLTPFAATRFAEYRPRFSPDGKWIAYISTETGYPVVYVRAATGAGDRHPVSRNGALDVLWNRDGRELVYVDGTTVWSVPVRTGGTFSASDPVRLFDANIYRGGFALSPDGRRFAVLQALPSPAVTQVQVVLNWQPKAREPD